MIPEGWREFTISDILIKFQNGYAFSSKDYVNEGYPIVSIACISLDGTFQFIAQKAKRILIDDTTKYQHFILSRDSVIIAMTDVTPTKNLIGRMAIIEQNEKYLQNQRVGHLVVKKDLIDNYFLTYFGNSTKWIKYCKIASTLGAQANISTKDILKGEILLPPLPEQKKIASILSSVDEAIQLAQKVIDQTELVKKGLLQELLTKGIGHTEFKKVKIGLKEYEVPISWKVLKLGDLFIRVRRTSKEKIQEILTISAKSGFLHQSKRFSKVIAGNSLKKYTLLKKNEFSYNKGNSKTYKFGCIYLLRDYEKALVPNVYISFKPKMDINPYYFEHYFLGRYLDAQLSQRISSTARMDGLLNISADEFFDMNVIVPEIIEQNHIATTLENIDKKIKSNRNSIDALKLTKKGLMQDLLTGKVRVKV